MAPESVCLPCWRHRWGYAAEPPGAGVHEPVVCACLGCPRHEDRCGRISTSGLLVELPRLARITDTTTGKSRWVPFEQVGNEIIFGEGFTVGAHEEIRYSYSVLI